MLTIENVHKIVDGRFMVGSIPYELYAFNDYPGRYEYWFWFKPIGSIGKDSRVILKRRSERDSKGERCYRIEFKDRNWLLVHPNDIQKPYGLLNTLEMYYK